MVNGGLRRTIKCMPAGEPQFQRFLLEMGCGKGWPADKGRPMSFLFRTAFWLSVVVLLLPSVPSQRTGSTPQISASEAISAASAAVSDMRQFCARQPDACVVGSQALTSFTQKAEVAAKMLYEYLTNHFGGQPGTAEKPARTGAKPPQAAPSPAELAAPWRGSPARREAEAKRPT
jgi:hypothetical protein